MTKKMQERAITASEKFVTRRGYEVLDTNWSPEEGIAIDLVADDDGTIVFIDVNAREGIDKGMPEENISGKRERMEIAAAKWLAEHSDDDRFVDVTIRFDIISMLVIGSDRALLRHHINCLGADFTDSTE